MEYFEFSWLYKAFLKNPFECQMLYHIFFQSITLTGQMAVSQMQWIYFTYASQKESIEMYEKKTAKKKIQWRWKNLEGELLWISLAAASHQPAVASSTSLH